MAMKIVLTAGGIGAKAARVINMVEDMKNFSKHEAYHPENIILGYKDQANADRKKFENEAAAETSLRDLDSSAAMIRSSGDRITVDITNNIRENQQHPDEVPLSAEWISRDGAVSMDVDKLNLFFTPFEQAVDTGFGYFQRSGLAAAVTNAASVYMSMIQEWTDRMVNGQEELYLVIPTGIQGAEGLGTMIAVLSLLKTAIHEKCVGKGMTDEQEKNLIHTKRHVLVIAVGGYRPPCTGSGVLAGDYKLRSTQILDSIKTICEDKADCLIYIASDEPLVISGKASALGGDQDYHSSLLFLETAAAVEKWMDGTLTAETSIRNTNGLNILVDPIDTLGQNGTMSYSDLNLPDGWKEMIATHISFSAAFLLGIKPMINGGIASIKCQPLFRNVFGSKVKSFTDEEMRAKIIDPITIFSELLMEQLTMLHDITGTGSDFITKPVQYEYSLVSLYNGPELAAVIRDAVENKGDKVDYDLSKLTVFHDSEDRNCRTEPLYLGKVIARVIEESDSREGFIVRRSAPSMDIFRAFRTLYETVRLSYKEEEKHHE